MVEKETKDQETNFGECVLNNSWMFSVIAVALAVPVGIRLKSYVPLIHFGIVGTGVDIFVGVRRCRDQLEDPHI